MLVPKKVSNFDLSYNYYKVNLIVGEKVLKKTLGAVVRTLDILWRNYRAQIFLSEI